MLFYAVLIGFSFGLLYILPLKLAYAYFPDKKGLAGGLILAAGSIGSILWSFITVELVNPNNVIPSLYLNVGNSLEVLYGPQQEPIQNVTYMLKVMSYIFFVILSTATLLINKKETKTFDDAL